MSADDSTEAPSGVEAGAATERVCRIKIGDQVDDLPPPSAAYTKDALILMKERRARLRKLARDAKGKTSKGKGKGKRKGKGKTKGVEGDDDDGEQPAGTRAQRIANAKQKASDERKQRREAAWQAAVAGAPGVAVYSDWVVRVDAETGNLWWAETETGRVSDTCPHVAVPTDYAIAHYKVATVARVRQRARPPKRLSKRARETSFAVAWSAGVDECVAAAREARGHRRYKLWKAGMLLGVGNADDDVATHLLDLPVEMIVEIIRFLSLPDMVALRLACATLNDIVGMCDDLIARQVYIGTYGAAGVELRQYNGRWRAQLRVRAAMIETLRQVTGTVPKYIVTSLFKGSEGHFVSALSAFHRRPSEAAVEVAGRRHINAAIKWCWAVPRTKITLVVSAESSFKWRSVGRRGRTYTVDADSATVVFDNRSRLVLRSEVERRFHSWVVRCGVVRVAVRSHSPDPRPSPTLTLTASTEVEVTALKLASRALARGAPVERPSGGGGGGGGGATTDVTDEDEVMTLADAYVATYKRFVAEQGRVMF